MKKKRDEPKRLKMRKSWKTYTILKGGDRNENDEKRN